MDAVVVKDGTKQEVARETKGDRLDSNALLSEKLPQQKPTESNSAIQHLPSVEFVISHGQENRTYTSDGKFTSTLSDQKVDPDCKNGVSTASGSEQRFDGVGLCHLSGNVHWGKSSTNGIMDITLDGKVKMQLDRNFQLVGVQSEHASFNRAAEMQKAIVEKTQASLLKDPAKPAQVETAKAPVHPSVAAAKGVSAHAHSDHSSATAHKQNRIALPLDILPKQ